MVVAISLGLQIVFYILYTVSVLLHLLGLVCLIDVYRSQEKTVQDLYLINLCSVELLRNLVSILGLTASLNLEHPSWRYVLNYVIVINAFGLVFINYMAMIFLTLDRLLMYIFDVEYSLYWNMNNAKVFIGGSWLMAVWLTRSR